MVSLSPGLQPEALATGSCHEPAGTFAVRVVLQDPVGTGVGVAVAVGAGVAVAVGAGVAVAVTGVAGPTGGSREKPVGTVCFAWALRGGAVESETCRFEGDRESIRRQSVIRALQGLLERVKG